MGLPGLIHIIFDRLLGRVVRLKNKCSYYPVVILSTASSFAASNNLRPWNDGASSVLNSLSKGKRPAWLKKEQLLAEVGLFSASLHYFLLSAWGKHSVVDLCMGKTFSSWQQDFSITCHPKFIQWQWWILFEAINWTIQIKLDGAQSDAFLLADVIRVDFFDSNLFVVTSQTWW